MKTKIIAFLSAAALILSMCPVFAESTESNLTTSLRLTELNLPVIYHSCNNDFRHTSTGAQSVVWYGDGGYWRTTLTLDDGSPFDKVYRYVCEGGGGTLQYANNNLIQLTIPTTGLLKEGEKLEVNDGLYLALYYRSKSEFTSPISGEVKQGNNVKVQPSFVHNSYWNNNGARVFNLTSGENSPEFIADGKWHKLEMATDVISDMLADNRATPEFPNLIFQICFGNVNLPSYIEFGAAQAGLLKTDKSLSDNTWNRIYTEMGWQLKNTAPIEIKVNDTIVKVENGVYEYTAAADSLETPEIEVVSDNGLTYEVEKLSNTQYKVVTKAPGYDILKDADGVTTYKQRIDTQTGEYKANGTVQLYDVTNAEMVQEYIINLDVPTAEANIRIGYMETDDLTGCGSGDSVEIDVKYSNIENREYNYLTVLVLRNGAKVVRVVPFHVTVAEDEVAQELTHKYTLTDDDYTGVKAQCYVIDMTSKSNVLK
ncbi:MAG: hypothetical protein IJC74_03775 [Clostridia bacterium]|nr:hypothetical protein [Clostridia bacterium]